MNNNMDDCEVIETKFKSKIIIVVLISLFFLLILSVVMIILSTRKCVTDLSKHDYYVLEINEINRDDIISLLKNEDINYCESINKIEYTQTFMDGLEAKIYCEDNDAIIISNVNKSKLYSYVVINGSVENR